MSKKNIYLVISILLFLLILYVKPLGLSLRQSVILASTAVVILWWATNSVSKTVSSVIIVLVFFTFSGSSTQTILKFPLSGNLILIAASYLIAHGIKVSGLADRISRTIISRYAKSGFLLTVLSFVLSFILIFLIPQPFPRAIIMAALYSEFLNKQDISARTKSVLLLFLTAAFSIGGVLNQEGIAEAIFEMLLPSARSDEMLIFFSVLMVMALHVFLGSSMTTMSICMPVLMSSLPASVNPVVMMFTIYTAINIHYILPIHHVVIMIGEGEGLYDTSMTIRYGVFLTMLAVISVYAVLMPYWRFIGVL